MKALLPHYAQGTLGRLLPSWLEATWYKGADEALRCAVDKEIVWYDLPGSASLVTAAQSLRWIFTVSAGIDGLPVSLLSGRGIRASNGVGLNADNVADYAVMGILAAAKGFPEVIRAQQRREWLHEPPGRTEMAGSRALILGFGHIGRAIAERLAPFGVIVTAVRSHPEPDRSILGPDEWRRTLRAHDWIILAAPATDATRGMISQRELCAMKSSAWLINVGRGSLIDCEALLSALETGRIQGAFLDVTDPEPLPPEHPLWRRPNAIITMHLSARSQSGLLHRAARLFLQNLECFQSGGRLVNEIDWGRGY